MGHKMPFELWLERLDDHVKLLTNGLGLSDFQNEVSPNDLIYAYRGHHIMRNVAVWILETAGWGDFLDTEYLRRMGWHNA